MVHALGAPIIGVAVLLVCGYFAQMQWRSGGDTALALGLGFFALLGLLLVAEYVFARHTVFDEGMHYSGLLTCRRTLRWGDIVQVRYSRRAKWFRLTLRNGEVVRIAAELRGRRSPRCCSRASNRRRSTTRRARCWRPPPPASCPRSGTDAAERRAQRRRV